MEQLTYKLCFYVPETHLEAVKLAIFKAGAGQMGNYDCCAWQTLGQGQFRPLEGSQPFLGQLDKIEHIAEYKVETVCNETAIPGVLQALIATHPYEHPAYDLWPINQPQGKRLRCFLAVDLDQICSNQANTIIEKLKKNLPDDNVRWTTTENLHLTIKYIGLIAETKIENIANDIKSILINYNPFTINLNPAQYFPNQKHPRAIAMEATCNDTLTQLADDINQAMLQFGVEANRHPFRGHLSLARIRHNSIQPLPKAEDTIQNMRVSKITLYHSETKAEGAIYHVLRKFDLKSRT